MDIDWGKYQAAEVLSGMNENGGRLISLFARDFKKITGNDICHTCNSFTQKFNSFIQKYYIMIKDTENTCGFRLKPMYQNIPASFGSPIFVNNNNITDELALGLLKNHPRGKDLFDVIPEGLKEEDSSTILVLEKEVSLNKVVESLKCLGVKTKATTTEGIATAISKLKEEQKGELYLSLFPETTEVIEEEEEEEEEDQE
jgi:hypothetical protein